MLMRIYFMLLAAALLIVFCAIPALAVASTIDGVVTDADGRPVPGAVVTLFDSSRAEVTSVDTGAGGRFVFDSVQLNTDLFTIRVFYTDRHQSYTNVAYLTKWFPSKDAISIDKKDTRLEGYHKTTPTPSTIIPPVNLPFPVSTPGFSAPGTVLILAITAMISIMLIKNR
jgi:hypothetical protein